jgi:hypothetical protein
LPALEEDAWELLLHFSLEGRTNPAWATSQTLGSARLEELEHGLLSFMKLATAAQLSGHVTIPVGFRPSLLENVLSLALPRVHLIPVDIEYLRGHPGTLTRVC